MLGAGLGVLLPAWALGRGSVWAEWRSLLDPYRVYQEGLRVEPGIGDRAQTTLGSRLGVRTFSDASPTLGAQLLQNLRSGLNTQRARTGGARE